MISAVGLHVVSPRGCTGTPARVTPVCREALDFDKPTPPSLRLSPLVGGQWRQLGPNAAAEGPTCPRVGQSVPLFSPKGPTPQENPQFWTKQVAGPSSDCDGLRGILLAPLSLISSPSRCFPFQGKK